MQNSSEKTNKNDACPQCLRPKEFCFCEKVQTYKNVLTVLILQHPQEQYKLLNSASLSHAMLENSILKVGLSWRNLSRAWGHEADPKQWGVLYLKGRGESGKVIEIFDSKKRLMTSIPSMKGLVAIDGSWKQAKTLWWRNPWLLRLNRIMLNPQNASRRPQAKKEGLSTIEAIALALESLGENPAMSSALIKSYEDLILSPLRP